MLKKGLLFVYSLLMGASVLAASLPSDLKPTDLRVYGDKQNPAIIYVFSSLTCPHCSIFHRDIMPDLKSQYVDTGKAKLILVDMAYDSMAMTGFTISRCISPDKYDAFMSVMFENQMMWANAEKPREVMTRFATMLGGMTKNDVDICLANEELKKTIIKQRTNLSELYGVTGMPTVVVVKGTQSEKIEGADKKAIFKVLNERLMK